MQFEEELLGLSRLSVDMGLVENTRRDNDFVECSQSDEAPESFEALLARLNSLRQAQSRRKPQPKEEGGNYQSSGPSSDHKSSSAPTTKSTPCTSHMVDKTTTVVPARRKFRTSPRSPAPDALGARKLSGPKAEDNHQRPDSGILLSRSGRLCYADSKAVETLDVDSMAPNSVFSAQVDIDMGMGMGHWCRDVVGRELMAAERCGWAGGYGKVQPERKLRSTKGVRI